jgi:hypothetical protein
MLGATLLGVVGTAGCGGGGGSLTTTSSQTSEGAYDPVPSIDALPPAINPTTYQAPPGTYDSPPGQTNAGGVGAGATIASVCSELCTTVLSLNCPVKSDSFSSQSSSANSNGNGNGNQDANPQPAPTTIVTPDACTAACVQAETTKPCPNEMAAAMSCILDHVQLSCDLLAAASDQQTLAADLAVSCQTALLDYVSCRDAQQAPEQTCVPNSCMHCADGCARCACQNNGDRSNCRMCPPG